MVSNSPSAVSKTICVDLLNISLEELQNLSIINPIVDTFSPYLFFNHKVLHNDIFDEDIPHLVYMEEDFMIATNRHLEDYKKFSLGGFEILSDVNKPVINPTLYNKIETLMINSKSLYSNYLLDVCLKVVSINNENEEFSSSFLNGYIEVSNKLALSPKEVENQFNITTVFQEDEIEKLQLTLKKIYYKGQFPLIFVYSDEKNQEYMGWNKEYLIALANINPINCKSIDNVSTLNIVLDRINEVGLKNLKAEEIAFLDYLSRLD